MPVLQSGENQIWRRREPAKQMAIWFGWFCGVALFMFCWNFISERTTWMFVFDAPRIVADISSRMFPPRWSYIDQLWIPIWDTVNIATLGTLFSIVMAVPVAFMAARNTTPSARFVRPIALLIIVSSRSINSLIWALLLVSIVGPGLFAGVIAISLRSIGFVAKLLYEAIEEIDENQVEAVAATGASRAQIIAYGIVPQIMPAFAGITVFRWDINIRESTVLGLVGAGGIGFYIQTYVRAFQYNKAATLTIVVVLFVVLIEAVNHVVRASLR